MRAARTNEKPPPDVASLSHPPHGAGGRLLSAITLPCASPSTKPPSPSFGAKHLPLVRAAMARAGAGRLPGPARGRASERISARRQRPAGLADRLHRLGGRGRGDEGPGRRLRRWPLHRSGSRPGRCGSVRDSRSRRGRGAGLSGARPQGRRHRLRPASAQPRCAGDAEARGGQGRGQPKAHRQQSRSTPPGPRARPAQPQAPVVPHEDRYAGETSASKRARIGEAIADGRRRRRRPDRAVVDRLAVQCPGRRRDPLAPAAGPGHRRPPTARPCCSSIRQGDQRTARLARRRRDAEAPRGPGAGAGGDERAARS